jgi:hypothetical protein
MKLPSTDFESVFFTSHQLAPRCTQKQSPFHLLQLEPITICTAPQSAVRDSGTKYHHLYPQKLTIAPRMVTVDRQTGLVRIPPALSRA